jgi:hypothetical protein
MFDDHNIIFSKKIFILKFYFANYNHYFSPLNTNMKKGKDP